MVERKMEPSGPLERFFQTSGLDPSVLPTKLAEWDPGAILLIAAEALYAIQPGRKQRTAKPPDVA